MQRYSKKLYGVNLGGWLVLERWMTPSVFAGTDARDEYTFMKTDGARQKIRAHHRDFITEADFCWMRDNGVNAVRIPVGYWVLEGDGPYVAALGRLDWAFRMAERYDIQVLLCLHGAPGSQNGNDHSGKIGAAEWFKNAACREKTLEVLLELARRYRDRSVLWGLELLNEPKMYFFHFKVRAFYRQAYRQLSEVLHSHTRIVFHDAFMPRRMSAAIGGAHPVCMDIHWYHFNDGWRQKMPLGWYFMMVGWRDRLIHYLQRHQEVVIGEWSGVIAHQKLKKLDASAQKTAVDTYLARQKRAYNRVQGWFYWTYKTEKDEVWNFRSMVESGKIELLRTSSQSR